MCRIISARPHATTAEAAPVGFDRPLNGGNVSHSRIRLPAPPKAVANDCTHTHGMCWATTSPVGHALLPTTPMEGDIRATGMALPVPTMLTPKLLGAAG